ncbi:hypothetical protein CVT24_012331 [Panaeolus cyanescens]|uniref:Uncharacterized protein n=1 Tax=Panaeolus cyanescens TaxID=181874 RepID=A0A409YJ30_9AGAR|nr:hypothetical protein CVT24_012331 [Panaeolus cyanescens]
MKFKTPEGILADLSVPHVTYDMLKQALRHAEYLASRIAQIPDAGSEHRASVQSIINALGSLIKGYENLDEKQVENAIQLVRAKLKRLIESLQRISPKMADRFRKTVEDANPSLSVIPDSEIVSIRSDEADCGSVILPMHRVPQQYARGPVVAPPGPFGQVTNRNPDWIAYSGTSLSSAARKRYNEPPRGTYHDHGDRQVEPQRDDNQTVQAPRERTANRSIAQPQARPTHERPTQNPVLPRTTVDQRALPVPPARTFTNYATRQDYERHNVPSTTDQVTRANPARFTDEDLRTPSQSFLARFAALHQHPGPATGIHEGAPQPYVEGFDARPSGFQAGQHHYWARVPRTNDTRDAGPSTGPQVAGPSTAPQVAGPSTGTDDQPEGDPRNISGASFMDDDDDDDMYCD